MSNRTRYLVPLFAALLAFACRQQEGEVCEPYPGDQQGDCAEGLLCCGATTIACTGVSRGRCAPPGDTCAMNVTISCDGDAGAGDAGPDAGVDAGPAPDAGPDAGAEDAGPGDAGPGDAGPGDAGPGDAGPGDAGPGDAGPGDAGPGDAGP